MSCVYDEHCLELSLLLWIKKWKHTAGTLHCSSAIAHLIDIGQCLRFKTRSLTTARNTWLHISMIYSVRLHTLIHIIHTLYIYYVYSYKLYKLSILHIRGYIIIFLCGCEWTAVVVGKLYSRSAAPKSGRYHIIITYRMAVISSTVVISFSLISSLEW